MGSYWKLLVFVSVILFVISKVKKIFDLNIILLITYLLLYSYFLRYHGLAETKSSLAQLSFIFIPISFYFIGKYLAYRYPYLNASYFFIIFIIFSISVIPFLSNILDAVNTGFMTNRNVRVIWANTEEGLKNATNVGSLMALNMVLFGMLFFQTTDIYEKKIKKIFIVLFLMGLFSVANMSTRTGIFLASISLFVLFLNQKKLSFFVKFLFTVLFILAILYLLGFYDWLFKSYIYSRFTEDFAGPDVGEVETIPRIFRWGTIVGGFFEYPLGGQRTAIVGNYAHNLWLDVGWRVGIVPLIPLLFLTIRFIKSNIIILRRKNFSPFFRALILSISIGFIMSFMVEPIMEGYILNFSIWCFFVGYFKIVENVGFNVMVQSIISDK